MTCFNISRVDLFLFLFSLGNPKLIFFLLIIYIFLFASMCSHVGVIYAD